MSAVAAITPDDAVLTRKAAAIRPGSVCLSANDAPRARLLNSLALHLVGSVTRVGDELYMHGTDYHTAIALIAEFEEELFDAVPESDAVPLDGRERGTVGSVYFARSRDGGPIKIGTSVDPKARIRTLSTSAPAPVDLLAVCPGARDREHELHQQFAALRLHGEWFRPEPELLDFIAGLPR